MAVTINEKPHLIDFAGNLLTCKLTGTPVNVAGRKAVTQWRIATMPRINHSFTVAYGGKEFVFIVKSIATARNEAYYIGSETHILDKKAELISKIAENYEISRDFQVTVSDTLEITFTALNFGGENVSLSSSDTLASFSLISTTPGIARSLKGGYKLFACLEIIRSVNAAIQQTKTPPMLFDVDSSHKAAIPLTLLRSCFSQIDIPGINEAFRTYVLQYATIRYSLIYSDYYDGRVQLLKRLPHRFATCGKVNEASKSLNLPDWITPVNETAKLSKRRYPTNYGCDSGLTVNSFKELPQFVYFMLFYEEGDNDYSCELQTRVDILNADGSRVNNINPGSVSITNFNIIRIPLSVESLSLTEHSTGILSYTVRIYPTNAPERVWKRTFILKEKPYFAHLFFLQNKYGVLESFYTHHESKEKRVEGEVVKKNGLNEIDISEATTVYTADTGHSSAHKLKLLDQAVSNPFNFKIVEGKAVPITILPDTFTISDEAEETQSVQFQYMLNIAESNAGEGSGTGTVVIGRDYFEQAWQEARIEEGVRTPLIWVDSATFSRTAVTNNITITTLKKTAWL